MSYERRSLPRMMRNASVSLQLTLPSVNEMQGRVVWIETLDISATGLRVTLPEPVDPERMLDLCIELAENRKRFLLTGEVRWCRPGEASAYEAGIEILDGIGTDFTAWYRFLSGDTDPSTPPERVLTSLSEPCSRLRRICEPYAGWEWDTWFRAALCVLESGEMAAALPQIEAALPFHWDREQTHDVEHLVFPVSARIGGLDHTQRLLTTAPDASVVLFAALWPWGNGRHVSIRVGFFSRNESPELEAALEAQLRECFGI